MPPGFSNPPYSCIPDFRSIYLFMYDLYNVATHKCMYLYDLLIYQPYRCIEMSNFGDLLMYSSREKGGGGAIPAAHVYYALYRELPRGVEPILKLTLPPV